MKTFIWTTGTLGSWTAPTQWSGDDGLSYPGAASGPSQDLSFQTFGTSNLSLPAHQAAPSQTVATTLTIVDTGMAGAAAAGGTTSVVAAGVPTLTTLVTFNVTNGANPNAGLIARVTGDLFGTTSGGFGTVFEIANTAGSYASTPTTLVSFNSTNGGNPGALIADAAGDLFGTTANGGTNNGGTVFEIAYTGGSYASTPATLVSFGLGASPQGGLLADAAGDLFGTTYGGGAHGDGTVFEITKSGGSYASTPTTLTSFYGYNGANPWGVLIDEAAGDLFGTTSGGGANGDGTVFEIANTSTGYASTPTTLVSFNYTNGANPTGGLILDAAGDLFGTTADGGANSFGTVFEIAKTSTGYAGTPTILVNFDSTNGATPVPGLLADGAGDLFGTTRVGATNAGTVFEVTDTGFVTCYLRGTRIATPDGEHAIEWLAEGDLVLTKSGEARPIAWIGHRHVDCRRHPKPEKVWPVRVSVGAFGPRRPHTDLYLSPDHAVYVNEVLIPVKHLINGSTVAQVPVDQVTYYHIELPRHDVVLAQGLPAESYLDTGDRSDFANGGGPVRLFPDFSTRVWEAHGCAPLIVSGPELAAARALVGGFAATQSAA